jgi:hypothetical protein
MTDKERCNDIEYELRWLKEGGMRSRVKIDCTRQQDSGTFNITIEIDGHMHTFDLQGEKYERHEFEDLTDEITSWEEKLFQ